MLVSAAWLDWAWPVHVLDIVGGPAAAGYRRAAEAEGMDRQTAGRPRPRRVVDRPVAALAHRLGRAVQHEDLDIVFLAGAALDLAHRRRGVLIGDDDGGLEPGLLAGPEGDLPVVDGAAIGVRKVEVLQALAGLERVQHAEADIVRVEMLGAHEGKVAAGPAAGGRIGVAARGVGLALRIGRAVQEGLAGPGAVALQMALPALLEEGVDLALERFRARMDVAVGDPGVGLCGTLPGRAFQDFGRHGSPSLRRG